MTTTTPKAPPLYEGWDSDDQRWYWADLPLTIIPRSRDVRTLAERARASSRFLGARWGTDTDRTPRGGASG